MPKEETIVCENCGKFLTWGERGAWREASGLRTHGGGIPEYFCSGKCEHEYTGKRERGEVVPRFSIKVLRWDANDPLAVADMQRLLGAIEREFADESSNDNTNGQ